MKKPFLAVLVPSFLLLLASCVSPNPSSSSSSSISSEPGSSSSSSSSSSSISSSSSSISSTPLHPERISLPDVPKPTYESWLEVSALEMAGQYGDCTLYNYHYGDNSFDLLVDAGPQINSYTPAENRDGLIALLKEKVSDHVLDMIVLSHQHGDHYGGLHDGTLQEAGITMVSTIVDNGVSFSYGDYHTIWEQGVRDYWTKRGGKYYPVQSLLAAGEGEQGALFTIDPLAFVLFLDTGKYPSVGSSGSNDNPNKDSVAMSIHFGKYDFVTLGDLATSEVELSFSKLNMTPSREPWFSPAGSEIIFKANHHGSAAHTTNTTGLLDFLKPSYSWASSAMVEGNQAKIANRIRQHPHDTIASRLAFYTGKAHGNENSVDYFFWNGTMGTIHFTIASIDAEVSIKGIGRNQATYYSKDLELVDPESEKNLPYFKTAFAQKSS